MVIDEEMMDDSEKPKEDLSSLCTDFSYTEDEEEISKSEKSE